MRYLKALLSREVTAQSAPIPGTEQVPNNAGGYAWAVDDWTRLDRFLILGSEGGSYYVREQQLTRENAQAVLRCLQRDGPRAVRRIVEIAEGGRAPKADPALFALALGTTQEVSPETRALALGAVPRVCRIGTHLFHFAQFVNDLRGWGRGLRRAIASWYEQPVEKLAYQAVKYQARDGWSNRDLLRLAHPRADPESTRQALYHWMVKGWESVDETPSPDPALRLVWAFERAKRAETAAEITRLIREYRLPRECVPTQWLTETGVWDALLEEMPMTALIRNLATMTRVGLVAPNSEGTRRVLAQLADGERLRRARVHPIAVLAALKTYAQGRGERGKHTWEPVSAVVDALDSAFYAAFGNLVPTGKRWVLGLDVSGSMSGSVIAGIPGLTPRVGSAALALVTAAVEENTWVMAFSNRLVPVNLTPRKRLDSVLKETDRLPFGGTDCALPMLWALEQKVEADVFVIYTDSETWYGKVHPAQALRAYRQKTGIPARLVVVGMVANQFSIADPEDGGMLDVVGFDTATPNLISDFASGRDEDRE